MCKLELLLQDYKQAVQNFDWAERGYVREAIQNLCVLETLIEKEIKIERGKK